MNRRKILIAGNALIKICINPPAAPGQTVNAASSVKLFVKIIYAKIAYHLNSMISNIYREASKFWENYPTLFSGAYPLPIAILEKKVN